MLEHQNFKAWVCTEGISNDTYSVTTTSTASGTTVSGWIASEAGKKFSVNWSNASRDFSTSSVLKIDGAACCELIMRDYHSKPVSSDTITISHAWVSEILRRDFFFANLEVTDDDNYLHTLSTANEIRDITLELWRIEVKGLRSKPYVVSPLETRVVHERSKKAGAHHVKLGAEYACSRGQRRGYATRDLDKAPFLTFIFKYRDLGFLIANGIVPRPTTSPRDGPIPQGTTSDGKADAETSREIRELKERLRVLQQRVSKAEPQQAKIKPEPVAPRRASESPIVIDLTMED